MAVRRGRRSGRCWRWTRTRGGGWRRSATAGGRCCRTWGAGGGWRSTTPASRRRRRPATMPAEAVVWFNPSCSKCRLAADALDEAGASFVVRRYLDDPPSVDELAAVLERLGLEPWDITRTADAAALGVSLEGLSRERALWLALLAEHPALIQRPIV